MPPLMRFVWGMLGGLLLALPAMLNGAPLVYPDTLAYMKRADTAIGKFSHGSLNGRWMTQEPVDPRAAAPAVEAPVASPAATPGQAAKASVPTGQRAYFGRSIYFGLAELLPMLLFGWRGAVMMNGVLTGCILAIAYFSGLRLRSVPVFLAVCLMLSLASSAAPFTALLLPDFLTSLLIVGVAVAIAFSARLAVADWIILVAIATLATVSHDTNLALTAVASVLCALLLVFRRRIGLPIKPALALCLGLTAIGMTANVLYARVSLAHTGKPAIRYAFLTAHIQQLPVGTRYLREHCDGSTLLICHYRNQVPQDWEYFLFGSNGIYAVMDDADRATLEAQQGRLALNVLRTDPLAMIGSFVIDGLRQNIVASYENIIPNEWEKVIDTDFPKNIAQAEAASWLWQYPHFLSDAWEFHKIVAIVSVLYIVAWLLRAHRRPEQRRPEFPDRLFVAAVMVGAIMNAFLCGVLASPYPRFEARVTWLFPLLAMLVLAIDKQLLRKGTKLEH